MTYLKSRITPGFTELLYLPWRFSFISRKARSEDVWLTLPGTSTANAENTEALTGLPNESHAAAVRAWTLNSSDLIIQYSPIPL